ncbi:hypothetical protein C8J57DRAFT_1249761 [Mycena rebaudengoi]|nr:hypothetical protein C8J57DRAFT_1249761 [Mycena rebaudengoi]
MAGRAKREGSTARPGDIINNSKQKRRTRDEIEEARAAEEAKAFKLQAKTQKKHEGVRRVSNKEQEIREQDEHARVHVARPHLVTAQIKRVVNEKLACREDNDPVEPTSRIGSPSASHTGLMDVDGVAAENGGFLDDIDPEIPQEGADDGADDSDDDYGDPPGEEAGTDSEDEHRLLAEFMELRKTEKAKAAKKKPNPKPAKGALRAEIDQASSGTSVAKGTKRKVSQETATAQTHKKPKAALGGLKNELEEGAPSKSSSTVQSRASSTTSTSARPSATSSEAGDVHGEFDEDEDDTVLAAARGAKSKGAATPTAKMGITFTQKEMKCSLVLKIELEAEDKNRPKSSGI